MLILKKVDVIHHTPSHPRLFQPLLTILPPLIEYSRVRTRESFEISLHYYRCVPDNKRSFALGMQTLIIRVLTLPAPVLIGAIVDRDCITWAYDTCGQKKYCLDYDVNFLSKKLVFIGSLTAGKLFVIIVL